MKIKECMKLASDVLNLDAMLTGKGEYDAILLRCANNCIDEIASEYLPIVNEVKVESTDGKIAYSKLGTSVYDVVWVKKNGLKTDFKLFNDHIKVKSDGEYEVRFYTRPKTMELDDDVPMELHLTPRVISYGIAAEYLLINGYYEEATTYDRRFKDALIRLMGGDSSKRIKRRRWLL